MPPRESLIGRIATGTVSSVADVDAILAQSRAVRTRSTLGPTAPPPYPAPNVPSIPTTPVTPFRPTVAPPPMNPLTLNPTSGPPSNVPTGAGGGPGWEALGQAACDLLTNPIARAACRLAATALPGGSGGQQQQQQQNQGLDPMTCPPGYTRNAQGVCQQIGISPYLPGDIGRPDYVWTPVNGRFGAGVTPIAVQTARRVCPAGMVLGKDGVCYDSLPRTKRAHNPGARPLLTGGDMNALRRARQLQKTIGRIARRHGPKKSAARCAPKKRAR